MVRSGLLGLLVALLLVACGAGVTPSVTREGSQVPAGPSTTGTPPGSNTPSDGEPGPGEAPIGPTERATVLDVVDGDTIVIDRGLGEERVRYIGVDTPETVKPNTPVEFMGKEASAANRGLVEGREVLLERDITEFDRYGRLLRYVWVEDTAQPSGLLMVNLALVAGGFAQVVTYPPDVRYVDAYLEAQRDARERGLGLWSDAAPVESPAPGAGVGDTCDPAYPDVCIPPPPPDLDCGDVTFRGFDVRPPDPHRFDLNFDGVACEGG